MFVIARKDLQQEEVTHTQLAILEWAMLGYFGGSNFMLPVKL